MSKSTILVIFVATALALQVTAQPPTTPTYFLSFCRSKMGNYTNSTYQTNIQTVLVKLDDQSSTAQFSNATAGLDSGNQVFGQYYCRGDVNSSLCHDCVKQAADTIFTNCTHFKSAVVWYDECTLRYDMLEPVFGSTSGQVSGGLWSPDLPDEGSVGFVSAST